MSQCQGGWVMGGTQSTYKASQMFGYKEMKEKPSHQFSFGSYQGPQIRRVQRVTAQNGSLRYSLVLEDFVCQQQNLKVNYMLQEASSEQKKLDFKELHRKKKNL